jgi:hypothetical protein
MQLVPLYILARARANGEVAPDDLDDEVGLYTLNPV